MKNVKKRVFSAFMATIMIFSSTVTVFADSKKPKVYAVATGHLDTAWNWPIDKTIKEYLPTTLLKNFDLFQKYPDYNFNFEGAFRYELIKEYYPDLYETMKRYIKEKRWFPVGAVWENGDVNVPSSEALMRNILYGNNYFEKEFGVVNTDLFLPDCFGFGYALPTIANHMGLKSFSSAKLIWSNDNYLPFDLGVWKGVDGSSVVATLNPEKYGSGVSSSISTDQNLLNKINNSYNDKLPEDGVKRLLKYYGSGSDTGNAANESEIQNLASAIAKNNDSGSLVEVISAYAGQMAEEMSDKEIEALKEYSGELQLKFHGNGTFTASTISKLLNRKNEQLADAAERVSVAAKWLGAKEYPVEKLTDAWLRVIAAQHHDILTGTSISAVYADAINDYIIALNEFAEELESSASGVIGSMDTNVAKGVPVVVSNTVSTDRQDIVEAKVTLDKVDKYVRVYDNKGQEVPSQVKSINGQEANVIFLANIKANGYATYSVVSSDTPCSINTGLSVSETSLESNRYKVEINKDGNISRIYDKANNKEMLIDPITLEQFSNSYTNYGVWEIHYDDIKKGPASVVRNDNIKVKIVENGKARVALQIERTHNSSTYSQTISLSAGENANRVDVDNNVMWGEKSSFMKAAFPVNAFNAKATYDLGIGTIQRDNNDENQFEVPAQQWADITNEDGSYGVTIMNDSKYGWDKPEDNELRLTLFHVPQEERADNSKQDTLDFGENRFTYSIMGHAGDWRDGQSQYEAANLNQPLKAYQTTKHTGSLNNDFSFASLSSGQVMIKAIKKAEKTDEIIVRVNELYGKEAKNVALSMGDGIESFKPVNGYETKITDNTAKLVDGKLVFDITSYAPKTFAIKLKQHSGNVEKINTKAVDISSLYNMDIISNDKNVTDGSFGASRFTFPSEVLPKNNKVTSGGIVFNLSDYTDGKNNAIEADGQNIILPKGTTKVHLLAGSQRYDKEVSIKTGDKEQKITIQSMWEYVGGWDQYGLDRYGEIKKDPIALVGNHTHDPSGDMIYDKSYMYKYDINVPDGVEQITLPKDKDLVIASVTAQIDSTPISVSATELYLSKEVNKAYHLTVENGTSSGVYHYGNPVQVTYTGDINGSVVWTGSNGSKYIGQSVMISMPNEDLKLTPEIIPYGENLALNKPVTVNSEVSNEPGSKAVDGTVKDNSKWCATNGGAKWLTVDLGEEKTIDTYVLKNAGFGGENIYLNTADFQIQIKDENGAWVDVDSVKSNRLNIYTGSFNPVYTRYVRLNITKATAKVNSDNAARIFEFELYNQTPLNGNLVVSNPFVSIDANNVVDVSMQAYSDKPDNAVKIVTKVRAKDGTYKFSNEKQVPLNPTGWERYKNKIDVSSTIGGISEKDRLEVYISDLEGNKLTKTVMIENIGEKNYINPFNNLEAENRSEWSGGALKVENTTTSLGKTITNIGATYKDAWIAYNKVNFESGANAISVNYVNNSNRCASDAKLEIRLGSETGKLVGTINIPPTADNWEGYKEITANLNETITGLQNVYVVMKGSTGEGNDHPYIANIDYLKFHNLRNDYENLEFEKYNNWSAGSLKTEGGNNGNVVAGTYNNAWLSYKGMNFGEEGVNQLKIQYVNNSDRCASDSKVEVRLGSETGELVGSISVPATSNNWNTYGAVTGDLTRSLTGIQDIYLVLKGSTTSSNPYVGNFDKASFSVKHNVPDSDVTVEFENRTSWSDEKNQFNNNPLKTESNNGGTVVANTYNGAWLEYKDIDFGVNGKNTISITYDAPSNRCPEDINAEIHLGSSDGEIVGMANLPITGSGWGNYKTVSAVLDKTLIGTQNICVVLKGSTTQSNLYVGNIDKMIFSKK